MLFPHPAGFLFSRRCGIRSIPLSFAGALPVLFLYIGFVLPLNAVVKALLRET
jgi:hypothetical protein